MSKLIRFVSAFGLLLLVATPLAAQQAQTLLEEGLRAYRQGDQQTAISRFREIVEMDPANYDAQRMLTEAQDSLVDLMMEGGEYETFVRHLLATASDERREALRDEAAAAALAQRVLSGSYEERAQARFELLTTFGPFAVPPLVASLATGGEERRSAAVYALSRMGTEMTLPLLAASWSTNDDVRSGVVLALGNLRDPRAAARMADIAQNDTNPVVRNLATQAGASGNAAALHFQQGMAFIDNDLERGLTAPENYGVVWVADGPRLTYRETPPSLVALELARMQFARAAELGHSQGQAAVAMCYGAELATLAALGEEGSEELAKVRSQALTLPVPALNAGLALAVQRGDAATAEALVGLLSRPGLETTSGLRAALAASVPGVRYAAAIALAATGDSSQEVVHNLSRALRLQPMRVVLVVDGEDSRRTQLANDLAELDIAVLTAKDGAGGLVHLYRNEVVDAFVIADPLPDFYARRIVAQIKKDPRHGDAPVLVIGNEETGSIDGATVAEEVTAASVEGAFQPLDEERRKFLTISAEAARSLYQIGLTRGPSAVSAAREPLTEAVGRDYDEVAIPALGALGFAGDAGSYSAMASVLSDADRSVEARAAAANGIAILLSRVDVSTLDLSALQAGLGSEQPSIRDACARALGAAGTKRQAGGQS